MSKVGWAPPTNCLIFDKVIDVPAAGDYYIWAREWAPDAGSDSFYAEIDTEGQITWETQQNDGWIWDRVRGLAGEGTTSGPSPERAS